MLLKPVAAIRGDKHFKSVCRGASHQLTILEAVPLHIRDRENVMPANVLAKTDVDAFVQQKFHAAGAAGAGSSSFCRASSRTASACSRVTLGKPVRKSSSGSPPSR